MKKLALLSLLLSFTLPVAFASNHEHSHEKCECSKECKENCNKGKTENCECKDCGCKQEKTCH